MKESKGIINEIEKSTMFENHRYLEPVNRRSESPASEFDFFRHVYDILIRRSYSVFFDYYDLYSYLGRRFCLRKNEIKKLLRSMQMKGYLVIQKRGVKLLVKSI